MHAIADHLFVLPSVHTLLQHELDALAPELAGVFGRQGLFVRPHAMAPDQICAPMLGRWVCLHTDAADSLAGDLSCSPQELPFADDSFRVILVQHASERLTDASTFRAELARVLEPGGIVLVVGFHPLSPWRPWLAWQQRHLIDRVRPSSASRWRDEFAQAGVLTYSVRRVGGITQPDRALRTAYAPPGGISTLLAPLRPSYLLLARKRVRGVTPLPVLRRVREKSVRPHFASGSQRARA
ncbi:MAG: methyltransferase domain-containing protein [Tahibacter sp.]